MLTRIGRVLVDTEMKLSIPTQIVRQRLSLLNKRLIAGLSEDLDRVCIKIYLKSHIRHKGVLVAGNQWVLSARRTKMKKKQE